MSSKYLNARVQSLPASGIRAFFELVIGRPDVLSLGVGEPDFISPLSFRKAGIEALEKGFTRYTSNYGLLELREEIAKYTERIGGPAYRPKDEILVTVGVSEAMDLALRAVLNPGDEVILADPSYVAYAPLIAMAGGTPAWVPTSIEEGWRLKPERVSAALTPKTKAILLAYPANPTGTSLDREELEGIAAIARERDLVVITDEIYDRLTYGKVHVPFPSIGEMRERTIYLNGVSKAFAMTGWRIGWACAPAEILEAMMRIHQYGIMSAPTLGQVAAIEALRNGWGEMERMFRSYSERRGIIVEGLRKIGLPCALPEGAFYAFPRVREIGLDDETFCRRLLAEENVAVVPGSAFGPLGAGHVRIAYAASLETIHEALSRMQKFVARVRVAA